MNRGGTMTPIHSREQLALDTINQVQLAIKSTGVYPQDHPITSEIINRSYESLVSLLNGQNRLDVRVNGNKLFVDDVPVGVSFFGRAWSEPVLLEIAYGFEQGTKHRRPPEFLVTD